MKSFALFTLVTLLSVSSVAQTVSVDPRIDDKRTPRWMSCGSPNTHIAMEGYLDAATTNRLCDLAVQAARRCASLDEHSCQIAELEKIRFAKLGRRLAAGRIRTIRTDRFDERSLLISVSFGADRPGAYEAILIMRLYLNGTITPEYWGIVLP